MEDKRFLHTRQALYAALGRLLQEKAFDRITVTDIVKEAGLTRKTFYNHYQDKIDLVQDYQNLLSGEILALQQECGTLGREFFVKLFTLIGKKGGLLTGLFSFNGSSEIQQIMKGTMEKYCRSTLQGVLSDPDILEYQSVMMANVIFGLMQHWLMTGRKTTPEETADIILSLRFPVSLDP